MKLHFLGTCSGTEPMPGRRHQSFAVETGGALYWFDAGACCSVTAHLMGLDLLRVKKVVISHPHMDHVGGLGNLFWDVGKLRRVKKQELTYGEIDLYIPELETWEGFAKIISHTENHARSLKINAFPVQDGLLFRDENMAVTAYHNRHMKIPEDGVWKSFSYLIEAEGKRIAYSGDIKEYRELDAAIGEGCDAVLAETGHHHHLDVCDAMNGKNVKNLFFTHHGRSVLADPDKAQTEVEERFENRAVICSDATTFHL